MKKLLLGFVMFAAIARGQTDRADVALSDVLGPENTFTDRVLGVSLTYPKGWQVLSGFRWGHAFEQNTFRLQPPSFIQAQPSVYYQRYPNNQPPPATNFESYFREIAKNKEASRREGIADYRNEANSFVFKTVNGHPTCSYLATFSSRGRFMTEYFVRVAGQKAYVMFFTMGDAEDVLRIRETIDRMAATVEVP
jgi:hypothetical protein